MSAGHSWAFGVQGGSGPGWSCASCGGVAMRPFCDPPRPDTLIPFRDDSWPPAHGVRFVQCQELVVLQVMEEP